MWYNIRAMKKIIGVAFIGVGVLVLLSALSGNNPLGAAITGQAYTATTTDSGEAGTHLQAKTARGCEVGSVVIASSSATSFVLWNATSTTDTASTTLATFEAGAVEGTYTFDVVCTRGLVIEAPAGFNGSFVTTYK